MTDEKIIDKLRKLKAMAEGAEKVGNEAEAQAFATMVQTLLAKHKLEASDVEWEQHRQENLVKLVADPTDLRTVKPTWEVDLAKLVAKASSCRVLVSAGHRKSASRVSQIWFYGTATDAQGAREAYLYLLKAAKHLAERHYVKFFYACKDQGDVTQARGYKASWLTGFVTRLQQRYRENEVAIQSACAGTALIRLSQALARVDQTIKETFKHTVTMERDLPTNAHGYVHGKAAANQVKLANDPTAAATQLPR